MKTKCFFNSLHKVIWLVETGLKKPGLVTFRILLEFRRFFRF